MATVQRYVDTGCTAGGDGTTTGTAGATRAYASLVEWEANQASADNDFIVDCAATNTGSGNLADTGGGVTINFTTITNGSVTIQQTGSNRNTGNTFLDTSKYRLVVSSGSAFVSQVKNLTLRGLQVDHTHTGFFENILKLNSAVTNNLTVEYCRLRSASSGGLCGMNGSNPTTFAGTNTIRNNICIFKTSTSNGVFGFTSGANATVTVNIYHNTIYSTGSRPAFIISGMGGSGSQVFNIKNNVVMNTTDAFSVAASSGVYVANTDYNWTDDGTEGTTNEQNLPSLGSTFTSTGNGDTADFSLLQALATGGAVGSITDDIVGTTRGSPPDAGAFEFGGGGPTYTLTSDSGSFTLTGIAAALKAGRAIAAASASFSLTGQDATLTYTPVGGPDYTLTAANAAFTLTGNATALKAGRRIAAAQATFSLTGNAAGLARGLRLNAAAATYALTGNAAGFRRTYVLDADPAAYTLTGMTVSFDYSGQQVWTPVSAAGGTWTPATPAGGTWTPQ